MPDWTVQEIAIGVISGIFSVILLVIFVQVLRVWFDAMFR